MAVDCSRICGPADRRTVACRAAHAYAVYRMGQGLESIRLLNAMWDELSDQVSTSLRILMRADMAYRLGQLGRHRQAASLWRELIAENEQRYGPGYNDTIYSRQGLARCLAHSGQAGAAVEILSAIVRSFGSESVGSDALRCRRRLASAIGLGGDPIGAARRMRELAQFCARVCGTHDPETLAARSRTAHWSAVCGEIDDAVRELEVVLPLLEATCGPGDEEAQTCRQELEYWRSTQVAQTNSPPG